MIHETPRELAEKILKQVWKARDCKDIDKVKQLTNEELDRVWFNLVDKAKRFVCEYFDVEPSKIAEALTSMDRPSIIFPLCHTADVINTCENCYEPAYCPFTAREKNGYDVPVLQYDKASDKLFISIAYKKRLDQCKGMPYSQDFLNLFKKSDLPPAYLSHTFENYQRNEQETITAKALALLALRDKTSLILAGKAGTGKTHLATAIALERMQQGDQAYFRLVSELLDEIRQANISNTDNYSALMEQYKKVPCLVLDDLGKERATKAGYDYLYQIIDARYRLRMQTIITTNATTLAELELNTSSEYIRPMISRLLEFGSWCSLTQAEDFRLKKARVKAKKIS